MTEPKDNPIFQIVFFAEGEVTKAESKGSEEDK